MGFPPIFGGAKEKGAAFPKPKDERLDPTVMPTTEGFFGEYGGAFLPPPLVPIIDEIKAKYLELKEDPSFWAELRLLEKHFTGRPVPYPPLRAPQREGGRRADLPKARGSQPHRRAQD
jgi:tryptophan synthase beta chain